MARGGGPLPYIVAGRELLRPGAGRGVRDLVAGQEVHRRHPRAGGGNPGDQTSIQEDRRLQALARHFAVKFGRRRQRHTGKVDRCAPASSTRQRSPTTPTPTSTFRAARCSAEPRHLADVRTAGSSRSPISCAAWKRSPSRRTTRASTSRCRRRPVSRPTPTRALQRALPRAAVADRQRRHATPPSLTLCCSPSSTDTVRDSRQEETMYAISDAVPNVPRLSTVALPSATSRWLPVLAGCVDGWSLDAGRRPLRRWPPIWGRGPTRRCTCCCRRRCSTSTSPTSTCGSTRRPRRSWTSGAGGKPYSDRARHQIAQAAMDAQRAVVQMKFVRDIPFDRWIDVVKENLEQAREAGLISQRGRAAGRHGLPLWFAAAQGSRLPEGRPADVRDQPATALRTVVVVGQWPGVHRSLRPGAEPGPGGAWPATSPRRATSASR